MAWLFHVKAERNYRDDVDIDPYEGILTTGLENPLNSAQRMAWSYAISL